MIGFSKRMLGNANKVVASFIKSGSGNMSNDFVDTDSPGTTLMNKAMKEGIDYDFMQKAYEINPWINSIVNKIIARVGIVDIYPQPIDYGMDAPKVATNKQKKKCEKIMRLFNKPNDAFETFGSLRSKFLKDVLIYDSAGMEIVKKGGENFELYCNATGKELIPNVDKVGNFKSDSQAYVQIRRQKIIASWQKYRMMHFVKNRTAGRMRGFSPIEAVSLSVCADLFSDKYNIEFFSNNARPNIAFLFENLGFGKGASAIRRAKEWYIQEHQGKPHLPLFMGAEKGAVKMEQMQLTNKDMEFDNYQVRMLSKFMAVYGMQPVILGMITETTGKLNSEEQTNQFKIDAVLPYLKMTLDAMNLVLIWAPENFGYEDIYLIHDDLDLKDSVGQALMYDTYLKNGVITINQVRQELKMAPVPWGDIPYIPVNIAPLGGAAPDRMSQNPAAADNPANDGSKPAAGVKAPDYGKPNKKSVCDDAIKKNAGLNYVHNSNIIEAMSNLISKRESELSKTFVYGKKFEEGDVDYRSVGRLKKIKY